MIIEDIGRYQNILKEIEKYLFRRYQKISKDKVTEDIHRYQNISEDIKRYWYILEDIGRYWKKLDDIGRFWEDFGKILEDIGRY